MGDEILSKQLLLRERLDQSKKLLNRRNGVLKQLQKHEEVLRELEENLTKEQQDVRDLDGFSLANMWRKWHGTQNEKQKKEVEEVLRAEMKVAEHKKMMASLHISLTSIEEQLQSYRTVEEDWALFLAEKKEWLSANNRSVVAELDEQLASYADLTTLLKEIEEAINVGTAAMHYLAVAKEKVSSAKEWSSLDMFVDGGLGLVASSLKHSKLDHSEDALFDAQKELQRFAVELEDVAEFSNRSLAVQRGGFLTFTDYFLDDIFSDWTVHNRINDSLRNIESTILDVENIMEELKSNQRDVELDRKIAMEMYSQLLVKA